MEIFPWMAQKVLSGETLAISKMEELSPEAAWDLDTWCRLGIKSLVVLPLSAGGSTILGALSFAQIREERTWPETVVNYLKLVAQVFANALSRKRADDALRRSEERLSLAARAAELSLWSVELATGYLWNSESSFEILGLDKGTALTEELFFSMVHSEDREPLRRTMTEAVMSGRDAVVEYRIIRPDGTLRWLMSRAHPYLNASGEPERLSGVSLDITERKLAEAALHESQERFRQVAENAGDFIWEVDADGLYRYTSPSVEKILGYRADEVVGRLHFYDLFTPEVREELKAAAFKVFATKQPFRAFPNPNLSKDGRVVHLETSGSPVLDAAGNLTGYIGVNSDVTERRRLEALLRQAHKMEAIGTLAGGIAHDFNNILAGMIGFAELAMDDIPADAKAQRHLKRIFEGGLRGRDLVRQILAFSRKTEGERKEISLTPLVTETHTLLRSSLPTTIQMPLVITTNDDYIFADPAQMQQVLMNLATNAAYAMREDGGQLTIGISSATFPQGSILPDPDMQPGIYVKLTVKDTGTGMTEEVRQRIFEPFFTTKEKEKGTGMGLAVVHGVVRSHGGAVTVRSEVGQGSTFEVFLPRVQKPEQNKEEVTTSLPTGSERVLFVDDEELLVEVGRGMLESLGYHVTVAANGSEAWNLFLADPSQFDLVITDQTMPDVTGVTLAQKMLGVRKEMPIILCTGYSEMVSAEKAKAVGIREFVMKPVVKKELAETIRRALDEGKG